MKHLYGLYAITDPGLITEQDFDDTIRAALEGGARIIQYRDKSEDHTKRTRQAKALRSLCEEFDALCIINDDISLADTSGAHGVHLGRDDISLPEARKRLGDDMIIGVSCYDDMSLALHAQSNTADYVAFGSMFASPTKPDATDTDPRIIIEAKQTLKIPVCAIGGITENNVAELVDYGADMTAVISSLFASDDIRGTAHRLSQHFS